MRRFPSVCLSAHLPVLNVMRPDSVSSLPSKTSAVGQFLHYNPSAGDICGVATALKATTLLSSVAYSDNDSSKLDVGQCRAVILVL